ncbi:translation initiation factor eIF 4e-like domain-containing protein [Naematelia encephala]|uniref:Translation initiation factor eIF 4e-like domain-containing protein n=1 Tax=Naematelia encephala TaxID=71784 RepID=A0A1Y2BL88_9TREE|nr:translation initiation factor eIF 4e-like domain-containing protein [Naematelia encephala]
MSTHDRYFWAPGGSVPIRDFIKKNLPSIISEDETPWIWTQGSEGEKIDPERDTSSEKAEALREAQKHLTKLQERLESIEHDDKIPARAKKGEKGKKAHREEAHQETADALRAISVTYNWTSGKWLFFPRHSDVDRLWATIAQSVAAGPLRKAGVFLAKVVPSPTSRLEGNEPSHLTCCYVKNVYDEGSVKKVLETLLKSHGLEPSACKSDLYTLAGIDSNHPTKLRSSLYRPAEMFTREEIATMKEEYTASKETNGEKGEKAAYRIIESDSEDDKVVSGGKRKVEQTQPNTAGTPKHKEKKVATLKKAPSAALKYAENDIFAGPEGDADSD